MILSDLLDRGAPAAPAIRAEAALPLTYSALRALMGEASAVLAAHGVDATTPVAAVLPNGPAMATAFLAVSSVAPIAPLNPTFNESELEFVLADLGARAVVTTAENDRVSAVARTLGLTVLHLSAPPGEAAGWFRLEAENGTRTGGGGASPDGRSTALLLHTSGTTARPKLVGLTNDNLCASALRVAASLRLQPSDCCLNVMPLFHVHGLVAALLGSLAAGASIFCSPGFNAHRFFGWLGASGATWYTAVPTMHQAILARTRGHREAQAAGGLRFVRTCSAPLSVQAWQALEETFQVPVFSAYGMTEASHQIACTPFGYPPTKRGTVGRPTGCEVAIMDDAGTLTPTGRAGEVVLRGPSVIAGYVNNPGANATSFTLGWFRTGDQGFLDEDGYLTLTGRLKELINTGGEKVAPVEVDAVLLEHPDVAQAVCFAVPDALLGEHVGAAIVPRPGASLSESEVRRFAADHLVRFKVPRTVVVLDAIPVGPTGKFQRTLLASQLGLVPPR